MSLTEDVYKSQKEIERLLAAAAFIAADYVRETCGWLAPESFVDERIRKFWEMLLSGRTTIEASYEADLQPDILKWTTEMPTSLGARDYANQIAKHNYLAGLSTHLSFLYRAIGNLDAENARKIIDDMAAEKPKMARKAPTAEDVAIKFREAVIKEGRNILTGIPGIDNNTGGLEKQTESILAGRPSMGKTAMALQIARNAAGPAIKRVQIFSLEMSDVSLWARIACPSAGVTWMDVKAKKLTSEQEEKLLQESQEWAGYYRDRLIIDEDTSHTTETVWRSVANEHPDLVVIDHLSLLMDKGTDEVKRLGVITRRMKAMAKEMDCHVMIVAQLNRSVENRTDKRPLLVDLRDSGEIEQNADQVFMLYRDSYYSPPAHRELTSQTELWLRKYRDGIKDARINLVFDLEKQWFDVPR